jgi:uncharacterized membrane protein
MSDTDSDMMRPALIAVLLACLTSPALAGLHVCNKTTSTVTLALGRFNGSEWMSQGWWDIPGHHCAAVIKTPLKARYYYLYAGNGGPGSWDGGRKFCVADSKNFAIHGRAGCARRGFDRKGFFEVDTGRKTDYTQRLSD